MVREQGELVGSGEGISSTWAVPHLDFFEGSGIRMRSYMSPKMEAQGDWSNEWSPTILVGAIDPDDSIRDYVLNEKRRIPLFELVTHDAVFSTSVWRFSNSRFRGCWDKVDLFCVLYGVMPFYNLTREEWDLNRKRYVEGHRKIQSVREKIGMAEMLGHQCLTEDRLVQETTWSTGDRVVVNFGTARHLLDDGTEVPPMGFHLVRGK